MKQTRFDKPSPVFWPAPPTAHGNDGVTVHGPGEIDPTRTPPDPRMIARLGASRAARLGILPWRQCGPDCIVLTDDPVLFLRHREELTRALGPARMATSNRSAIRQALNDAAGAELVGRAETRVSPEHSCRHWRVGRARLLIAAIVLGVGLIALSKPILSLMALMAIACVTLVLAMLLKIVGLYLSLRGNNSDDQGPRAVPIDRPLVSLLVPLFKEAEIAGHLLKRLGRLDYPADRLDICLILEEGDDQTRATLDRTDLPANAQVITVPRGTLQTKPRALNYALDFARGSIIGIYDAEDAPAPDQIDRVVDHFAQRDSRVACLQGVLDFYNTERNWMARCFTLEYATWFRLILPALERLGLVVPLGGTTLFLHRDAIEAVGGWDAHNVTEDADLGARLARHGYRTELIDTVTLEEANARVWPWVRQRSRWLKGYAMTYAVQMRAPVRLWRDLGAWRFAGVQVLFLGTLLQLATAPILWSFWLHLFGLPHPIVEAMPPNLFLSLIAISVLSEAVSFALAVRATTLSGRRRLWLWAPTMILYFPLATIALYKALWEMLSRPFFWDKTTHGALGGTSGEAPIAPPLPSTHQA